MPKFTKGFIRRKSTTNALEDVTQDAPAESSFRVFERTNGGSKSFDGAVKLSQTSNGGGRTDNTRPESADSNIFAGVKLYRNSETSHTNTASTTASTTDNSSRLSGASTAPSSMDMSKQDDLKVRNGLRKDIPIPAVPKPSSTFSFRNAGRAMSWSRSKAPVPSPPKTMESMPQPLTHIQILPQTQMMAEPETNASVARSRAMTTSTYASTATPPKLTDDLDLSLDADFGDMFSGLENRKSTMHELAEARVMSHSPSYRRDSPNRPQSSGRLHPPPPLKLDQTNMVEVPPYSWSSQHSNHSLISKGSKSNPGTPIDLYGTSPPPDRPPPPPPHRTNALDSLSSYSRTPRPGALADNGLKRSSAINARRQSTLDIADGSAEDALLLQQSIDASHRLTPTGHSPELRSDWKSPMLVDADLSRTASPKQMLAHNLSSKPSADSMFDSSITESAGLALRIQEQLSAPTPPPPAVNKYAPKNKVMTPAQFEKYRQEQVTLKAIGGAHKEAEDDEAEVQYEEEEDDVDKQRRIAKQRRQQEAHMSVYRQQMMKVTGEALPPAPTARPLLAATQSTPNLILDLPDDGEDDDEDVPLGILAAHGFPSKSKPPTGRLSSMGSNPNLRAAANSTAASGGHGRLPAFARHLPQDPYVGAGLVQPANRESMAFNNNNGAGSVYGAGPSRASMVQPGGLVGVIANEERSRAMRRGSPNAQGEFPAAPIPTQNAFGGIGSPHMPQMPQMPMQPPMLTPGDQAQIQMSQQMSQFMQMQMQFMQMMAANGGQAPPMMSPPGTMAPAMGDPSQLGGQNLTHARTSAVRPNTMMEPTMSSWGGASTFAPSIFGQNAGYTPSIAPSERSNVGLPGRYRPVSQAPQIAADRGSRTSTMLSGALPWENRPASVAQTQPTVKLISKAANAIEEEDDDQGWQEMAKKREKKRSIWRTKRDTNNGLKDMLAYAES